ncbi:MAG: ABC transporter permease subunit, partial [Pseudomonadota bacterium]
MSGLAQGAIYALVALSMCVVYRATTVVNFGHGDLVMAGAFVVYLLVVLAGLPFLASAILAVALLFALGVAIELG